MTYSSDHPRYISIWFFIGLLLIVYGIVILSQGVYHFFVPPANPPVLFELHADFWWGLFLLLLGLYWLLQHRPRRQDTYT